MAGGVAGKANNTFSTTVHEPRDRTGLPTVASAHSGVSSDLPPRWKAHATPNGTVGKAEAHGVVCQTHNRVQSVVGTWWTSRKCSSLFSCSQGWSRRAEIMLGWICYVLTSTEDTLLRELELDRPSALGGLGPRPSCCSGALDHRWR